MNCDFVEMLTALSAEGVEFLIVGAYAVAGHGLPPNRIDILTDIDGVTFDEAWRDRVPCPVDGGSFSMISRHHLLANKRATGRPQDLADVARLEEGA